MSENQLIEDRDLGRRKFSETEKMRILLKGLQRKSSVASFCDEIGISIEEYYQWKKDILEIDNRECRNLRNGEAKQEINRLEIENIYLKQLVEDLKIDNRNLRKLCNDKTGKIVRKI